MSEHLTNQNSTTETDNNSIIEKRLSSRRNVIRGALAALAVGSVTSWGVYERLMREDSQDPNEPADGSPVLIPADTEPMQPEVAEIEPGVPSPLGEAEQLRELLEAEGEEAFIASFRISKEQAGTPSRVAEEFARNISRWISAGCTPEEIKNYTPETLADYQAEMRDKYGTYAATGLGDPNSLRPMDESELQLNTLFNSISELHNQVLEYYMNAVHGGADQATVEAVVVKPPQMGTPDPGSDRFPLYMELSFTVDSAQTEPIVAAGMFSVILHTATEFYEIELSGDQPIPQFESVAA